MPRLKWGKEKAFNIDVNGAYYFLSDGFPKWQTINFVSKLTSRINDFQELRNIYGVPYCGITEGNQPFKQKNKRFSLVFTFLLFSKPIYNF